MFVYCVIIFLLPANIWSNLRKINCFFIIIIFLIFTMSSPAPLGHTSASVIPLITVGRGMYSVMHKDSGVTRFLVCQIYSVEGSKYIKIRSPFQVLH